MLEVIPHTTSERVDDLPLILHWLREMRVRELIDQFVPAGHKNRQGLSYGQLSVVFLAYIITQSDHRLCAVEPWVTEHRNTLAMATGWEIGDKDATDDRLAKLVEVLGKSEAGETIEHRLGQVMIRAYDLPTEVARCDSSSFSVYHGANQQAEEESLLHYGYSKDRRPDLLQYRHMLGTLDPAGIPLVSATLPGNGADDPLYGPFWWGLVSAIGHKQFVYIADSKAASQANRAQLDGWGGIYCFPLPLSGQTPALLRQWVLHPPAQLQTIHLPGQSLEEPPIAWGFEMELGKLWKHPDTQRDYCWSERYLVLRSDALRERQCRQLHQHLSQTEAALTKLATKPSKDRCALQQQVQTILARHQMSSFFAIEVQQRQLTRQEGRGRPSARSLCRQVTEAQFTLLFQRQPHAIDQAHLLAGWRLYVTNASLAEVSLPKGVAYYREQWQLERGFHRFKRGRLPALPIYLQNDHRIQGLMFLLTLALRVFTLMEFVVRRQLTKQQRSISGLYAGNPKRATPRPSAEQLLKVFCNITLYSHRDGTTELTPLNPLQQEILDLMAVTHSIYSLPQPAQFNSC
jgi:transposase